MKTTTTTRRRRRRKANNTFDEGVSSGIGIWRDFDDDFDDFDDGARDRVRRVSRQLLSQGMYNIRFFPFCLSLSRVTWRRIVMMMMCPFSE